MSLPSSEIDKLNPPKSQFVHSTRKRKSTPVKNCFLNPNVNQTITIFNKRDFNMFLRYDCLKRIKHDKMLRTEKIKSSRKSINSILSSEADYAHDITDMLLYQEIEKEELYGLSPLVPTSSLPSVKSDTTSSIHSLNSNNNVSVTSKQKRKYKK